MSVHDESTRVARANGVCTMQSAPVHWQIGCWWVCTAVSMEKHGKFSFIWIGHCSLWVAHGWVTQLGYARKSLGVFESPLVIRPFAHRAYYRPNCRSHFVISPLVLSLDDWIPLFVDLNPLHSSDRGSIGSEGDRLEKVLFWRSSEQFLLKIFF